MRLEIEMSLVEKSQFVRLDMQLGLLSELFFVYSSFLNQENNKFLLFREDSL